MADHCAKFIDRLAECEFAIVDALASYSGDAFRLGYRDEAVEGMAHAIMFLNHMENQGRIDDSTIPLLKIADKLRADGIYDDVLARARQLVDAL